MDDTQRTRLIKGYRLRYYVNPIRKLLLSKQRKNSWKTSIICLPNPEATAPIVSFINYYPNCYVSSIDNQQWNNEAIVKAAQRYLSYLSLTIILIWILTSEDRF